jgi:predicted oxidoreductase (fatty acid repression mutant protein)
MTTNFWNAIQQRRSHYAIGKEQVTSDEKIEEIVGEALTHIPSSFNSQSARVVTLLGDHHDKLWDITKAELRTLVPPESFQATEEKINSSFRSGYGSILFFEDMQVIATLQEKFPSYSDNFPVWSHHSSGMLQFAIWSALALEGWGASLQHYNPVIDNAVKNTWNIPESWQLIAQMPFGKPLSAPKDKDVQPLAKRMKLFK